MTTEDVLSRLKAYLSSISDVTLYEGHPAVLVNEAVGEIERLRGETYLASAEAAEFHRDNAITMWDEERKRRERAETDLSYAKNALDRETARALKFGKEITSLEAKVAELQEALAYIARGYSGTPGVNAEGHSGDHCAEVARRALEHSK